MDDQLSRGCIVVGVDGSADANAALVWATDQARLERRPLLILHSADAAQVLDRGADGLVDGAARLAASGQPGVEVRTVVVDDDPREALIMASHTANLVVVGSHGRSRWRSFLLGSVSSAVARHATCPIVVTHEPAAGAQRGVLVGADGTAGTIPVIEFAFHQASLRQLPLTVMHCYWDIAGEIAYGRQVGAEEVGVDDLRMLLSEAVAGLSEKFPNVRVELALTRGLVDVALTDAMEARDLVVVGRRHHRVPSRLLDSSVTTAVLEHARGNVAVVPESPPASR